MKKNINCVEFLKCMLKDLVNKDVELVHLRHELYEVISHIPQSEHNSFLIIDRAFQDGLSESKICKLFEKVFDSEKSSNNIFYKACINNCYEVVNFLIKEGISAEHLEINNSSFTESVAEELFEKVYKRGHIGIVYLLLKAGFKVPKSIYNLSEKEQKKLPASCEVIDIIIKNMNNNKK